MNKSNNSSLRSDIFIAICFIVLIASSAFLQTQLKKEPQWYLFLFSLMTLASLRAKPPFKTSVPFYILLGTLVYITVFLLTNFVVDIIFPENHSVRDVNGIERRVMQMNWIWGVLVGIVASPVIVFLYHKYARRNTKLEMAFVALLMVVVAIIYLIYEVF